ncbi:uncharacterized protein LOC111368015 [Olea europaea var. sylvestris]|uniref:uncharacterized protein LOC111368015 n=1 Tax=Olea europaea var. sylvestris TaxID=158386 RepID=UPI000C1D070A|nr:uncharacterized protein LOC111368015 [Olea europaea var. sylvestris]
MAMAVAQVSRIYNLQHPLPALPRFAPHQTTLPTMPSRNLSLVRASKPGRENTNEPDSATFISSADLNYLVKLGAGSLAGAAAIKYGSIILPEITQPNIVQALIMITTPVIVAVVLLIKQSRVD